MAKTKWKIIRAYCKSISQGATYFAAGKAAHLPDTTYWRWKREVKSKLGKTLGDLVQELWDRRVTSVEDANYISAVKGNTKAQEYFLNNRARYRWRKDPDTVIHVGDDNSKHLTQVFQSAPDQIIFDDGDGDRASGLGESVPADCNVTAPEGGGVCQENRLP